MHLLKCAIRFVLTVGPSAALAVASPAAAPQSLKISVDLPPEVLYSSLPGTFESSIVGAPGERFRQFVTFTASPDGTQELVKAYSTLPVVSTSPNRGIAYFLNRRPIIAVGDSLPFGQGDEIRDLRGGDVNDAGELSMFLLTSDATYTVKWSAGTWTLIAASGGSAPGLPNSVIITAGEKTIILPNGEVALTINYITPGVPSSGLFGDFGAFTSQGPIFKSKDFIPLSASTPLAGVTNVELISVLLMGMDDNGVGLYSAGFTTPSHGEFCCAIEGGEARIFTPEEEGQTRLLDAGMSPNGVSWITREDLTTVYPYENQILLGGVPQLDEFSIGEATGSLGIELDYVSTRANDAGNWITTGWTNLSGLALEPTHAIWNGRLAFLRRGTQVDLDGNGLFDDQAPARSFDTSHVDSQDRAYVTVWGLNSGFNSKSAILRYDLSELGLGQDVCGDSNPNTTGRDARIELYGSSVAADDRLGIVATGLPQFSFGVPLMGTGTGTVSLNLCASPACVGNGFAVLRSEVTSAGAEGWINIDLGTNVGGPVGTVIAGQTWTFQVVYRDTTSTTACNVTNARSLTFQ